MNFLSDRTIICEMYTQRFGFVYSRELATYIKRGAQVQLVYCLFLSPMTEVEK